MFFSCLLVGFVFELGNVCVLVQCLGVGLQLYGLQVFLFNDIDVVSFGYGDVLLVIFSLFGDGELLVNGEWFFEILCQILMLSGLCYVVFGFGDIGYFSFCGFIKVLDVVLSECQVQLLLYCVDVDLGYELFFQ